MNHRKYSMTTLDEIQSCRQRGMSVREIAQELDVSLQGLQQVFSVLMELRGHPREIVHLAAHNPFGLQ